MKQKLPATRDQLATAAKPPKVKSRPKLFIREEDIQHLWFFTRAGELVGIDLLCGDGEKAPLSTNKH